MILVAIMAELMEEYTALLTSVLEHLFNEAPFPRRDTRPSLVATEDTSASSFVAVKLKVKRTASNFKVS
ncbi:hypothetical protein SADUNF_Sadunf11G0110900 [Salix dunnii]|uniref:Uncharacterized protein n=1 Tax=Salix dunnii TaxID=1413687 RepID=A0A835MXE5_9ROSI|nr:hypothetical protein SADUNF_Sadunf11G0110900 [Salix dunnii]